MAACLGRALVLAAISIGLAFSVNDLDWTFYTLVRDLPWAGVGVWGVGMALVALRRHGLSRLCPPDGGVWPRASAWAAGAGILALAAAAILVPGFLGRSERGLSLRVTDGWRPPDAGGPSRRVSRISFGEGSGPPWTDHPLTAALDGWLYAPVGGRYHFELTARGDALLELDGLPHLGLGDHGATLTTGWATNPETGARRAAIDLEMGFHRLALFYRRHPEPAYLRLRWTPPYVTRYRTIPTAYLLAGAPSAERREGRALALLSRRAGILAIVLGLIWPLGGLVVRVRDHLMRRAAGPTASGTPTAASAPVRDTGSGRSSDGGPAS